MPRWSLAALLLVGATLPLSAQQPTAADSSIPGFERPRVTTTLDLGNALNLAHQNSPTYRQALNNRSPATWGVRSAYASFLPTFNVSGGLGYTGSGSSTFGGQNFSQTSPSRSSNYDYGFSWSLNGTVLSQPGLAKATANATDADITSTEVGLVADVTTQYLNALEAQAQVGVAEQQLLRARDFQQLSQARYSVGQATLVDVRQAEVELGTAEVGLLRAYQNASDTKLQLFRLMGTVPPAPVPQIALVDSFPLDSPTVVLDDLLRIAGDQNPQLVASRAREAASKWSLRSARSAYLPSLSARAGWSAFAQVFTDPNPALQSALAGGLAGAANCQFQNDIITRLTDTLPYPNGGVVANCFTANGLNGSGTALDPAVAQAIRDRSNGSLFTFQKQPFQASLTVSLPIFTGFSRQVRLSQAAAQRDNAEETRRGQEILVRTNVESRYLELNTSWRAIGVQVKNKQAAADRLRLAQDRYRLGSGTALELTDAQNAVTRAEGDYNSAVFAYHRAFTALEAAVGRRLR